MKRRVRRRSNWFWFLLLNVLVSGATTLIVLALWDRSGGNVLPPLPIIDPPMATLPILADATPAAAEGGSTPSAVISGQLLEVTAVVGATDPRLEYVQLRRVGEGSLDLANWSVSDEDGNIYTFPSQPSLMLFEGAEVQLYTRPGDDNPAQMFWNRSEPVWSPGEWVTVRDPQGGENTRYQIP